MIETLTKTLLPGELPLHEVEIKFCDTLDDVLEFKEWLSRPRDVLALDTETAGLDPYAPEARIRLMQFGDQNSCWVINCEKWAGVAQWALENYTDAPHVWHNATFDYTYMRSVWPTVKFPWGDTHDTMIYMRLHDNQALAGLKKVSGRLFGKVATIGQELLDKAFTEGGWNWNTVPMAVPAYSMYSGMDVILTARLYNRMHHIHSGRYKASARLEMDTMRICADMSIRGMLVDRDYCTAQQKVLDEYSAGLRAYLEYHIGGNPNSGPQLARYFEEQNATLTKFSPKTGAPSFDKDALEGIAAQGHPIADIILEMRKTDKLSGTYFENLLKFSNNSASLIHPDIRTMEATTGRMSVTRPALQTLPSGDSLVRNAFLAAPGNNLVTCDFSQIEMRLTAHLSRDAALIAAFKDCDATGADFFTRVGADLYGAGFQKSDPRRKLIKNVMYGCLPTETSKILTRRGLLTSDDVRIGDETIGLNPATGRSEWTTITAIHTYDDAPVTTISNGTRAFTATEGHRWAVQRRTRTHRNGPTTWTHDITTTAGFIAGANGHTESRLVLATPADTAGAPITAAETSLIGWCITDGTLFGSDGKTLMTIRQKKHKSAVMDAIEHIPHSRYDDVDKRQKGYTVWRVKNKAAAEIMTRAGINGQLPDPHQFAAQFNAMQRDLLLEAMHLADGYPFNKSKDWTHQVYRTLQYLNGQSTYTSWTEPNGTGWTKKARGKTHTRKSVMTRQRLTTKIAEATKVWCPTTTLGTWTAEQNGELFLTGNSTYGAGTAKMAESARVPLSVMEPIAEDIFRRFTGVKGIQTMASNEANHNASTDGRPYIHTATGRRLFVDPDRIYSAANYAVQGLAADAMKGALVSLDKNGLGELLRLPVHDEVICEVPIGDVDDAKHAIREAMTITEAMGYSVQIPAEPEGPYLRWEAK